MQTVVRFFVYSMPCWQGELNLKTEMLHPAGVGIRRIKSQYRNFFFGTVLLKEPRHKEITNGSVVQPVVRHGFYKINALGNLKKNT